MEVKYPEIHVRLVGTDSNAFSIIGTVTKELKRGGATDLDIEEFQAEATSGDYDHLLQTVMKWVTVEQDD